MGLDTALSGAISSLRVNQEALSIISNNIANAGTEGFNRVKIRQTNEILNGVSSGVRIDGVERAVDEFLVGAARRQSSRVGEADTLKLYMDRTSLFFGQPGAENSINSFVDNFFSSMSDLANNPEQIFQRTNALEGATNLSKRISGLATNIEQVRFDVDQDIASTVTDLNNKIAALDNLNLAIKESSLKGGDQNPLLDKRDLILKEVTNIIDLNVSFSESGEATLFTPRGELLAPGQKFTIEYPPAPSIDTFINSEQLSAITVTLLDANGVKTNTSLDLVSAPGSASPEDNVGSGKLRALLDLRDTELPKFLAQLDEMAQTLKDEFNAIHNDGAGFPPPTSLTGTNLVDLADEHVFSGQVRIAILDDSGNPVPDSYGTGNLNPLTLDLSRLDSGNGAGVPSIQTIIDEINLILAPLLRRKFLLDLLMT